LVVKSATYQPVLDALTTGAGKDRLALIATVIGVNPDGLAPILAPESTAILTGLYRATKNVSLISYQAVIAITFVVFPLVSRATFQSDRNATQSYVSQTFRTALLLVSCVAVLIGAGGKPLLVFLFGNVYGLASASLLPLVGAMSCFALLFVVGSILTAGGRPGDAMWLAGLAAVLQMTALFLGMDDVAPDAEVLTWIATVTLASIGVPLLLACWVLSRRLEVRLPLLSAARALMVGALALLAVQPIPWMGIVGIAVRCLTAFVVFGVGLVVFREIGRKELEMVKRIVKRSKAG
jgi:O-antigen/teichoic acid export membrane protein